MIRLKLTPVAFIFNQHPQMSNLHNHQIQIIYPTTQNDL